LYVGVYNHNNTSNNYLKKYNKTIKTSNYQVQVIGSCNDYYYVKSNYGYGFIKKSDLIYFTISNTKNNIKIKSSKNITIKVYNGSSIKISNTNHKVKYTLIKKKTSKTSNNQKVTTLTYKITALKEGFNKTKIAYKSLTKYHYESNYQVVNNIEGFTNKDSTKYQVASNSKDTLNKINKYNKVIIVGKSNKYYYVKKDNKYFWILSSNISYLNLSNTNIKMYRFQNKSINAYLVNSNKDNNIKAKSSDTKIASLSLKSGSNKKVISIKAKTYTKQGKYLYITIYYNYYKSYNIKRVIKVKIDNSSLSVNKSKVYLLRYFLNNDQYQLKASVSHIRNAKIIWKSSNPKIASVSSNGLVKAKSIGSTTISANYQGLSKKVAVIVVNTTKANAEFVKKGGFNFDASQGIFYSPVNCWQRYTGYNDLYDKVFDLGDWITSKVSNKFNVTNKKFITTFKSSGKEWRIEGWKGNYMNMGVGGEVGEYYRNKNSIIKHYKAISNNDMSYMQFSLYNQNQLLFTRGPQVHWWINGFKPGIGSISKENLRMSNIKLTFKDKDVAKAFFESVRNEQGIKPYYINSYTIGFNWD
jgi:hypothetical protein